MGWIITFISIAAIMVVVIATENDEQTTKYRLNITINENSEIGTSIFEIKNLKTVQSLGAFRGFLYQYSWIDESDIEHIKTSEILDRDLLCPGKNTCIFELDMLFITKEGHVNEVMISILILDENDNRPVFPTFENNVFLCSVIEGVKGETRIELPLATDMDTPAFGIKS